MRGWGFLILLLTGALACAGAASTAAKPKWQLAWAYGKTGTDLRFFGVADDGAAAATIIQKDRSRHAYYFNGKQFKDIGSKVGNGSAARGINDRHQVVGYGSANATVTAGDLLNPKLKDSDKPHAFLYSGGKVGKLTQPSYATAVDDAGVVVGTFLAPDSTLHAFAWLTGGLRWAPVLKNKFIDLGPGSANDVTNPSSAWTVEIAGSVGALAGHYTLNVLSGKFTSHKLGFTGEINSVNAAQRGGGYQGTEKAPVPVRANLQNGSAAALGLPAPYTMGTVNAASGSGDLYGDLFNNAGAQQAAEWVNGRTVNLNSLFTKALLRGVQLTNVTDAATGGLFAGAGVVKDGAWAYLATPPPSVQLSKVLGWVGQTNPKVFAKGTRKTIASASRGARRRSTTGACTLLGKAVHANYADRRKPGFYLRQTLIDSLDQIQYGLDCGGKIVAPRGMPFHR